MGYPQLFWGRYEGPSGSGFVAGIGGFMSFVVGVF